MLKFNCILQELTDNKWSEEILFFFFLFVCTYDLFTGRWIPLAKLIAFICQCAYSSIKETTVTYAWARYSQWYSLGKGYSRRSLHFLALIWMFGTRHNENSIVRESKQRKGSLDNFSFRMVFIFFPPQISRIVIYLPNKRSTVSNACLRTIDTSHSIFIIDMYIYIVDICIYRSNKAYSNVEISSRNYKKQNSKHAMVNYYSTK